MTGVIASQHLVDEPQVIEGRTYGSRSRSINVVRDTIQALGTSTSELARILDTPTREMIFHWTSGQFRASPKYLIRMQHLLLLKLKGEFRVWTFSNRAESRKYWSSIT